MRALAALGLAAVLTAGCSSGPGPVDDSTHHETTKAIRADKDLFFRTSKDSPLPEPERAAFKGLRYYDIRPEFRVPAYLALDRSGPPVRIRLQTSTDQKREMFKVGALSFTVGGSALRLTAFADSPSRLERLFVPFGDLTNNAETYGGGRYLELDRTPTGIYDLDFNRAYHPFCVFNPSYECPVPPLENRLPIAIPAGEKLAGGS
jgi:uncharacterized protein (DUF1684 family)